MALSDGIFLVTVHCVSHATLPMLQGYRRQGTWFPSPQRTVLQPWNRLPLPPEGWVADVHTPVHPAGVYISLTRVPTLQPSTHGCRANGMGATP